MKTIHLICGFLAILVFSSYGLKNTGPATGDKVIQLDSKREIFVDNTLIFTLWLPERSGYGLR